MLTERASTVDVEVLCCSVDDTPSTLPHEHTQHERSFNTVPLPSCRLARYYRGEMQFAKGVSTGWPSLDPFYKVVPGEVTVVTGGAYHTVLADDGHEYRLRPCIFAYDAVCAPLMRSVHSMHIHL